jgi:hypothetical protein
MYYQDDHFRIVGSVMNRHVGNKIMQHFGQPFEAEYLKIQFLQQRKHNTSALQASIG